MTRLKALFLQILLMSTVIDAGDYDAELLAGGGDFAKKIYAILAAKTENNVLFSPLSVHSLLSLLYTGSRGETAEVISKILQLRDVGAASRGYEKILGELNDLRNVTLYLANKIYAKRGLDIDGGFKERALKFFSSEIEAADFEKGAEIADSINKWVRRKTLGEIEGIAKPGDFNHLTRLILLNAIYFKGGWANKFERRETEMAKFHKTPGETVDVEMMHKFGKFAHEQNQKLGAQVLIMPYENPAVELLIVLPYKRHRIAEVEEKMKNANLAAIGGDSSEEYLHVHVPKFRVEAEVDFRAALAELGLGAIFENGADFSGMLGGGDGGAALKVDDAVQKAVLEINEEGSVGAAITDFDIGFQSAGVDFEANRPFIVLLRVKLQESGVVLFMGRVTEPTY